MKQDRLIEGRAYWVKIPSEVDRFFAILWLVPGRGDWWHRDDQPAELVNASNQEWLLIPTAEEIREQRAGVCPKLCPRQEELLRKVAAFIQDSKGDKHD